MTNAFNKIEEAILMEDINKYFPGEAAFRLSSIVPLAEDISAPVTRSNSANKNNTFTTNSITTEQNVVLQIPKCITIDYKTKIIPKGTKFLVGFVGYDNTLPVVIAMGGKE